MSDPALVVRARRLRAAGGVVVARDTNVTNVAAGKGLFGPDGLAVRGLAGPPALGELGDKEQAASTFVEGAGTAEVRGGAAAVGDLADERPVPDETELDRALSVPDRVSYEFADYKPCGERRIVKTPAGEPFGHLPAGGGDDGWVGRQVPRGDLVAVQGVSAGDEQGNVVRGTVGEHGLEDVVAGGLQRPFLMGQCASQAFKPEIDVVVAGLDEAVGVERENAPGRQFDLTALEGQAADAERRTGGQVKEAGGTVRGDERGQRMAGAGQAAPAGNRIVDCVQARGTDVVLRIIAVISIRVGGEPADQVIKAGEELVGRQVHVRERSYGSAQPTHGGGRVDTMPDDIADNQGDTGSGERDHIEPVAAHAELGTGGQVATGDLHRRLPGESLRQQAALQG